MGTKRDTIVPCKVTLSDEILTLFLECDVVRERERNEEWTTKSKQLAHLLGLTSEWWTTNHIMIGAEHHAIRPATSRSTIGTGSARCGSRCSRGLGSYG